MWLSVIGAFKAIRGQYDSFRLLDGEGTRPVCHPVVPLLRSSAGANDIVSHIFACVTGHFVRHGIFAKRPIHFGRQCRIIFSKEFLGVVWRHRNGHRGYFDGTPGLSDLSVGDFIRLALRRPGSVNDTVILIVDHEVQPVLDRTDICKGRKLRIGSRNLCPVSVRETGDRNLLLADERKTIVLSLFSGCNNCEVPAAPDRLQSHIAGNLYVLSGLIDLPVLLIVPAGEGIAAGLGNIHFLIHADSGGDLCRVGSELKSVRHVSYAVDSGRQVGVIAQRILIPA